MVGWSGDGRGKHVGGSEHWPWSAEAYEVVSEPFEVVPAELTLTSEEDGLWVSLRGPEDGYRLLTLQGDHRGDNPVDGPLTVVVIEGDEQTTHTVEAGLVTEGRSWVEIDLDGAEEVEVTDAYGNAGWLSLG